MFYEIIYTHPKSGMRETWGKGLVSIAGLKAFRQAALQAGIALDISQSDKLILVDDSINAMTKKAGLLFTQCRDLIKPFDIASVRGRAYDLRS